MNEGDWAGGDTAVLRRRGEDGVGEASIASSIGGADRLDVEGVPAGGRQGPRGDQRERAEGGRHIEAGEISGDDGGGGRLRRLAGLAAQVLQLAEELRQGGVPGGVPQHGSRLLRVP